MNNIKDLISNLLKNFFHRNMKGYFVENKKELMDLIEELVPEKSTIGCGDSMTLEECRLYDFFRNGNFDFKDKYRKGITKEEKQKIYIENFSVDTFISSANAITEDGKIFNIDGNGSRVAPIIYGPKQVLIIVGINKVVPKIEDAIKRARQIAAPLDAIRLNKKTPCSTLRYCVDCKSPDRICNSFVAIEGQFIKDRVKIIIINENLGY